MLGIVIYKYYMYKLIQYIFYIISTESALYPKRPKGGIEQAILSYQPDCPRSIIKEGTTEHVAKRTGPMDSTSHAYGVLRFVAQSLPQVIVVKTLE